MAFTPIDTDDLESGKPVTNGLVTLIKTNLDDLDSRVASSGGSFVLFNEIVDQNAIPQGTMLWSFETESNFQALMGSDWSLVDSTTGTFTDKNGGTVSVPDASDKFLMNKGSGAEALRGLLGSKTKLPTNPFNVALDSTISTGGSVTRNVASSQGSNGTLNYGVTGGDSVTRPETVVANLFIKTGNSTSKRLIYRASQAMTLNTAKVTQLTAGVSGTVQIDIKVGATIGAAASVMSVKPSVVYSDGDNTTSTNAVFSSTAVAVGDWVIVEIDSLQDVYTDFHVQIEAGAST